MNRRAFFAVLLMTPVSTACNAEQSSIEPAAAARAEPSSIWVDATVVEVLLTKVTLDDGRVVSRMPETTIAKSVVAGRADLHLGLKAAMLTVPGSVHTLLAQTIDYFPEAGPAVPTGQYRAEDKGSLVSGTIVELGASHVAIQHPSGMVRAQLASDTVISTLVVANLGEFLIGDSISALVDVSTLRVIVRRPDES